MVVAEKVCIFEMLYLCAPCCFLSPLHQMVQVTACDRRRGSDITVKSTERSDESLFVLHSICSEGCSPPVASTDSTRPPLVLVVNFPEKAKTGNKAHLSTLLDRHLLFLPCWIMLGARAQRFSCREPFSQPCQCYCFRTRRSVRTHTQKCNFLVPVLSLVRAGEMAIDMNFRARFLSPTHKCATFICSVFCSCAKKPRPSATRN